MKELFGVYESVQGHNSGSGFMVVYICQNPLSSTLGIGACTYA